MTDRPASVFGFGTATLDFRIRTADFGPGYTQKLLAREVGVFGGGSTGNCLVQVARLGGRARWLGKLGDDWIGRRIVDQLEREGVDCASVLRTEEHCSPFNLAAYRGARLIRIGGFLLPNSIARLDEGELERLASGIRADDLCLVEIGEVPLPLVLSFCRRAGSLGARLVADVDLDPIRQCGGDAATVDQILRTVDFILPNREAMSGLYGDLSGEELVRRLNGTYGASVVVTAGDRGCFYAAAAGDGGALRRREAFPVQVVDTVGAGDAFHGGFLFALSRGAELDEAVETGSRCAALNCRRFGTREGMPTLDQLREAFDDQGRLIL